jgi:hypothetical protein
MLVCTCHPSDGGEHKKIENSRSKLSWAKCEILSQKQPEKSVAPVVEHLPNKCEALSSNTILPKKESKKNIYIYILFLS